jgi:hypothetical protein
MRFYGTAGHQDLAALQRLGPLKMTNTPAPPSAQRSPNCWQCRYFAVSHIPTAPYACRAMGFQSKVLPSHEVLRTDGNFCRSFAPKSAAPSVGLLA